ncbi:hypothetical protein EJ03DRAFT_348286 [Teratosphaeria nubilosa]|uniref:Uncharacterized protein n=1 Tax=Teratosphaeria nubilosa TaxID=161662 RepID=A0A6G1LIR7_9PEZI|nr:hypothetical protein EJ03DRAFT_348286 [Teratosphaeria nubilosa]
MDINETHYPYLNTTTSLPNGGPAVMLSNMAGAVQFAAMGLSNDAGTSLNFEFDFVVGEDVVGQVDPSTGQPFPECGSTASASTWQCRGYGAARCRIDPCVQSYYATIEDGNSNETLIEISRNWGADQIMWSRSQIDTHCIGLQERDALTELGYTVSDSNRWLTFNETLPEPPYNETFPGSLVLHDCLFVFNNVFANSLNMKLGQMLEGNISGWLPAAVVGEYPGIVGSYEGPQLVANAFSNYLRQNAPENFSTPAVGQVYDEKTCVSVRWAWIAYPSALLTCSLLFFSATMVESRPREDSGAGICKSSPLALLYHGLRHEDGSSPQVSEDFRDSKGMQALAKKTKVRLARAHDNVARLEVQGNG